MSASFKLYFMKEHILQIHFREVFFMFKKTRVRQIIEQLQKNLSDREISGVLGVSRNSAARIRQASDERRKAWNT